MHINYKTIKELISLEMIYEDRDQSIVDQKNIVRRFEQLNEQNQQIVNDIFISVCGYGLDTLIKRSKESYDDDRTT